MMRTSIYYFILPGFFIIFSFISLNIFRDYPVSMDEYNYVYQAKIFANGKMSLELPPEILNLSLNEMYMIKTTKGMFSKFPPFFSVLLAPFTYLELTGIVNPLLSTLSLLFLYLIIKNIFNRKIALLSTVLMGSNLYFIGYAASYYAQPLSLMLSLLVLLKFIKYRESPKKKDLAIMSSIIAMHFLTRPLDGMISCMFMAIICFPLICNVKERFKLILIFFIGLAFGALALMSYNYHQAGFFKLTIINTWHKEFRIDFGDLSGLSYASALMNSFIDNLNNYFFKIFFEHFINLVGPVVIFLCLFGIAHRSKWRKVGLLILLLFMLLYNFSPNLGWPQYGARYWYPVWLGIGLLMANGLFLLSKRFQNGNLTVAFVAIIVTTQGYLSINGIKTYEKRFGILTSMKEFVEKSCPPKTIVPINYFAETYRQLPPFLRFEDLMRNPFLSGDRIYTYTVDDAQKAKVYFEDFEVCKLN
jgi:4-amino-4-deoxy-L-arabinose transferase-like glycosyltransferase